MPERIDFIHDHLSRRTRIDERYAASAAPESIEVYLTDWRAAHALLGTRIETMANLLELRIGERERGEWPPPPPERVESPAVQKVVDLMAALEESIANAKATRERVTSDRAETSAPTDPDSVHIGPVESHISNNPTQPERTQP